MLVQKFKYWERSYNGSYRVSTKHNKQNKTKKGSTEISTKWDSGKFESYFRPRTLFEGLISVPYGKHGNVIVEKQVDYPSRSKKFYIVPSFGSCGNIRQSKEWTTISKTVCQFSMYPTVSIFNLPTGDPKRRHRISVNIICT